MDMREEFEDLLDQYWDIAYSEGHLGLDADHEGRAGEIRSKLSGLLPKTGDGSKAEPVAWAAISAEGNIRIWSSYKTKAHELAKAIGQELLPLYLHPVVKESLTVAPAQDSGKGQDGAVIDYGTMQVPDGWVAVPRSATQEMIEFAKASMETAGFLSTKNDMRNQDYRRLYRGMLSAAPTHPEQPLAMVADKPKSNQSTLERIASIAHHGGLIGYSTEEGAMNEIRKLTLPYWDKSECDSLQRPQPLENL